MFSKAFLSRGVESQNCVNPVRQMNIDLLVMIPTLYHWTMQDAYKFRKRRGMINAVNYDPVHKTS